MIFVALVALIIIGILIPIGFSSDSDSVVITYGEATRLNPEYKEAVNNYFKENANVDVVDTNNKVFTAKNVNDLYNSFTNQSYSIDQICSACLVDLSECNELKVIVDSSKVTVVTSDMYELALRSAGITKGVVYITSPANITGENSISEVLNSYESVTNIEMPMNVKTAANREIYTQSKIVENSDISTENLTQLVSAVKYEVSAENITDHAEIVKIINKNCEINNFNISDNDVESLASTIEDVHSAQKDAKNYEFELSKFFSGSKRNGECSINDIINKVKSI